MIAINFDKNKLFDICLEYDKKLPVGPYNLGGVSEFIDFKEETFYSDTFYHPREMKARLLIQDLNLFGGLSRKNIKLREYNNEHFLKDTLLKIGKYIEMLKMEK